MAPAELKAFARSFQRKAQFLVDFIEAENSMGFHASQEAARVLVKSVDYSQGQVTIRGGATGMSEAAIDSGGAVRVAINGGGLCLGYARPRHAAGICAFGVPKTALATSRVRQTA